VTRCVFSRLAKADIEAIGDHIANDNPKRALSFVRERRDCCRAVVDYPRAAPLRPELGRGVRMVVFGDYVVRDPRVFLMDEPLSNLDAKLRVQMRAELKRFHQDLTATVIYVTHDQLEAMTMADKMAVMNGGVLQQYDSPERVFANPVNTFVAGFVGSPAMNLLQAKVVTDGNGTAVQGDGWTYPLSAVNARRAQRSSARDLVIGARHSTIEIYTDGRPGAVPGRVYTVEPTGDATYAHVYLGSTIVVVSVAPSLRLAPDDRVWIDFDQA
jgi:multiple sugar transport system ATP-binding protein